MPKGETTGENLGKYLHSSSKEERERLRRQDRKQSSAYAQSPREEPVSKRGIGAMKSSVK